MSGFHGVRDKAGFRCAQTGSAASTDWTRSERRQYIRDADHNASESVAAAADDDDDGRW